MTAEMRCALNAIVNAIEHWDSAPELKEGIREEKRVILQEKYPRLWGQDTGRRESFIKELSPLV